MAELDQDASLSGYVFYNADAMYGADGPSPFETKGIGWIRSYGRSFVSETSRRTGGPHGRMGLEEVWDQLMEGTMRLAVKHPIGLVKRRKVQHELKLQHSLVNFLRLQGVFCWINFQPLIRRGQMKMYHWSSTGVADILGIYDGKPLAIEVKYGKGKTTKRQGEFLDKFEEEGGIAIVARSIEDIAVKLKRQDWLKGMA